MLSDFRLQKTVQSKSVPKMTVFRKCKGLNIKYSYWDPQKAHPWPNRRLLTYFHRNPFRDVGCSELQEPEQALKTSHPGARQNHVHVFWDRKPLKRSVQNFACRVLAMT